MLNAPYFLFAKAHPLPNMGKSSASLRQTVVKLPAMGYDTIVVAGNAADRLQSRG